MWSIQFALNFDICEADYSLITSKKKLAKVKNRETKEFHLVC